MNRPLAELPWGMAIGLYLPALGALSGAALANSMLAATPKKTRIRSQLRVLWVSWALYVAICSALVLDLGRPDRSALMLVRSNWASPLSFGAKLLFIEGVLLSLSTALTLKRSKAISLGDDTLDGHATRLSFATVAAGSLITAAALAIYPAWLLSRVWFAPYAKGWTAWLAFAGTSVVVAAAIPVLVGAPPRQKLAWVMVPALAALCAHILQLAPIAPTGTVAVLVCGVFMSVPLARRAGIAEAALALIASLGSRWILTNGGEP